MTYQITGLEPKLPVRRQAFGVATTSINSATTAAVNAVMAHPLPRQCDGWRPQFRLFVITTVQQCQSFIKAPLGLHVARANRAMIPGKVFEERTVCRKRGNRRIVRRWIGGLCIAIAR